MRQMAVLLGGIGGKAVRRCLGLWRRRTAARPGVREAVTMFDYDATDDPC